MRSFGVLIVTFILNLIQGNDLIDVVNYKNKNVTEGKTVPKREAAVKSSDFFPDWVPFKNLHGDQLGEFEPVSKRSPRKRLAPPFNYLLKSVADSESSDDYFDKSPGGSEDDYEKSDWSDVNRDIIPVTSVPKLNHTDLTDIDGVVTSIQNPLSYVVHVARDDNNTKTGHNYTPSKQNNKKPFQTLDKQSKERSNYDPYQEIGPLKENKRSKKKLYEEFDYDEIDKIGSNYNSRQNKKVNIFKTEGVNKHSNGKRQTHRDTQNNNEDERLKELIESELFIVKKLYGKQDVLPFPNESDQFEEHGDMLVGKYDEQTIASSTTTTVTTTVKPSTIDTKVNKNNSQLDLEQYNLRNLKNIQSVFDNPSLYLESETENITKPTIESTSKESKTKKTSNDIQQIIKPRHEKAKNHSKIKHEKPKFLVPNINSKDGEPTLFFPSKTRHESRKKKYRENKLKNLTNKYNDNNPSTTTTHFNSSTELLNSEAGNSGETIEPSNQEIRISATDLNAIYLKTKPSHNRIAPSNSETEIKYSDKRPSDSERDALSSETGPSGSETGPSSSETGPSSTGTGLSSLETGPSSSETGPSSPETRSSSSENEPSGPESGLTGAETGPSSSETDLSSTQVVHLVSKTKQNEKNNNNKNRTDPKSSTSSLKIEPLPWFSEDIAVSQSLGDSSASDSRTHVDAVSASTVDKENKKNQLTDEHTEKAFTEPIIEIEITKLQRTTEVTQLKAIGASNRYSRSKLRRIRKRKQLIRKSSLTTSTTETKDNSYVTIIQGPDNEPRHVEYATIITSNETYTEAQKMETSPNEINSRIASTTDFQPFPNEDITRIENSYHTISMQENKMREVNHINTTTLNSQTLNKYIEESQQVRHKIMTSTPSYYYYLQYENEDIYKNVTDSTTSKNYYVFFKDNKEAEENLKNINTTISETLLVLENQENKIISINNRNPNLFKNESREIKREINDAMKTNNSLFKEKTEEEIKREILDKFNDINKSYNRILKTAFIQNDLNVIAIQRDIKEIKDLISKYDNVKKSFTLNDNEIETNTYLMPSGPKVEHSSSGFVDIVVDKLHGVIKATNNYSVPSDNYSKQHIIISKQHEQIWEKLKQLSKLTLPKSEDNLNSEAQVNSEEDSYTTPQPSSMQIQSNLIKPQTDAGFYINLKFDSTTTKIQIGHNQNHTVKKGGHKEYHSEDEEENGEHGKKAYEAKHESSKAAIGKHDKEDHLGKYEDHGGYDKYHHDESGHSGSHRHVEKGNKHAQYEESGKHSKGHSTKGSHDIHKKEEYEKKVEFFEEDGDSGEEEKYGNMLHKKRHASGGQNRESNLKAGHKHHQHGSSGDGVNKKIYRIHQGHQSAAGHDEHMAKGQSSKDTKGGKSLSNWVYHQGNPAKTANLVIIDRRGDLWPIVYGRR